MGRPEKDITHPEKAVGALAVYLRRIRARSGLTYSDMEVHTAISAATLARAASGVTLPTLRVALTYNRVCRGSGDIRGLWEKARREERGVTQGATATAPPRLDLVGDRADLSRALVETHRLHGAPSLRTMERRADEEAKRYGATLSRSTAHRILTRKTLPSSPQQLRIFLNACRVPGASGGYLMWVSAWLRAEDDYERKHRRRSQEFLFGPIHAGSAVVMVREAGFYPEEDYRGFTRPWTVRCRACRTLCRIRLSDTWEEGARCPGCLRIGHSTSLRDLALKPGEAPERRVCPDCRDLVVIDPRSGSSYCPRCVNMRREAVLLDHRVASLAVSTGGSPFRI
ncbi:hypothetical protein ACFC7A_31710 [Streptomyces niveus]|uniref:hypothetical protein n=1 Tax=Streptomyces niveus TaxID=193462 RepID=UPI0035D6F55F